jgi:hypothetical protein
MGVIHALENIPFGIGSVFTAIVNIVAGFVQFLVDMFRIIVSIPPEYTYKLDGVVGFWGFFRLVAIALLVLIAMIGGIQMMIGRATGVMYVPPSEFLPRVLMAFLGCNLSLWLCQTIIDLANTVGNAALQFTLSFVGQQIASAAHTTVANVTNNPLSVPITLVAGLVVADLLPDPFFLLVVLVIVAFVVTLIVQGCARLILVNMLIVLSPLGIIAWVLPQTRQWAALWLNLFITTVIEVFLQVIALCMVFIVLFSGGVTQGNFLIRLTIAILGFSLMMRIPKLLTRVGGAGGHDSRLMLSALLGGAIYHAATRGLSAGLFGVGSGRGGGGTEMTLWGSRSGGGDSRKDDDDDLPGIPDGLNLPGGPPPPRGSASSASSSASGSRASNSGGGNRAGQAQSNPGPNRGQTRSGGGNGRGGNHTRRSRGTAEANPGSGAVVDPDNPLWVPPYQ